MKKWTLVHKGKVEKKDQGSDIMPEVSQILRNRGIDTDEKINMFMNPSLDYLRDPYLLKDMDKTVERIKEAVVNKERVWIYGDYDVDGVSSTSVFILYFKSIGFDVRYYIPNRLKEGYGINKDAIDYIESEGCDLIISVDCGITSVEEATYAKEKGIDMIITDHHECQDEIPDAYAVVNPKQSDCNYPFDMLCGCGVAFKIIQALTPDDIFKKTIYDYIEIVTLATICDVVPLVDENRIIVKNGLELMKNGRNTGLKALIGVCGVDTERIGSSHIGFTIGPRINASGRLGFSDLGVSLFTETDPEKAVEIAHKLDEKNEERQMIELKIHHEAEMLIKNDPSYNDDKVLVMAHDGWQHGVIGIVASKLTEKYYKPTVLMCIDDGKATGSARSIKGFSIFDALCDSSELLDKFGGHEQAAGLSIDVENLDEFRKRINAYADEHLTDIDMVEEINAEFELSEESADFKLIEELHRLEPFGVSNPTPRFIMRNCLLNDIRIIGKNRQHLKLEIEKNEVFECIGFNMAHLAEGFRTGDKIDILFQLDENTFMGNRRIQMLIKDIRMAYPKAVSFDETSVSLMEAMIPKNKDSLYHINDLKFDKNIDINGNKIENIAEFIKPGTLVITNTIKGYFRAVSDISLVDYDYSIYINEIDDSTGNEEEVKLIFTPNIDKIDLKRYNNIILYDYLYNEGSYADLYSKKSENNNIILNYSDIDQVYLKNIIDNMVPERKDFVDIYRYILKVGSINIKINDIKSVFRITPIKAFAVLRVFEELELVSIERRTEGNFISIKAMPKPDVKLDLDKSEILTNLKKLKLESYSFYKF